MWRAENVHDGDTLTVVGPAERRLRVRLASIDAPELGQPSGPEARRALEALVRGVELAVDERGTDRYGRTIAKLRCNGVDVSHRMIELGWAWQFTRYDRSREVARIQFDAAESARGLWQFGTDVVPPWEWRRRRRA